jgi:hypothetical protein
VPLSDAWALRRLSICVRSLDALPVHARRLVEHLADPALVPSPSRGPSSLFTERSESRCDSGKPNRGEAL